MKQFHGAGARIYFTIYSEFVRKALIKLSLRQKSIPYTELMKGLTTLTRRQRFKFLEDDTDDDDDESASEIIETGKTRKLK